jgi:mannose-6-phosphate isomerase
MHRPYPLIFESILKEKVWGGRRLAAFGKKLPRGVAVGESWEVADLPATSPSGGGGGAARSIIINGSLAGKILNEALALWGDAMLGGASPTPDGNFPLLVKLLDAGENLSVQVHPSREYAAAHPTAHVKSETWYVLEAEPGAVIYKGVRPGTDREALADAIRSGAILDHVLTEPARPGDCHHLPSGTLHALGAGVLVAEVQSPSDTTFRLYDWAEEYGRSDRQLHIDEGLDNVDFGRPVPVSRLPDGVSEARLARSEHYDLWELRPADGGPAGIPGGDGCAVLTVLSGSVALGALELSKGMTALIPAAWRDATVIEPGANARYLVATLEGGG